MKIVIDKTKLTIITYVCFSIIILTIAISLNFMLLNKKPNEEEQNNIESEENQDKEDEDIVNSIDETNEEEIENEIEEENTIKNSTTPLKDNNQVPNTIGATPYYIKVNYGANVVTIYGKDNLGNYTVPVKVMICSTGDYTPPCAKYPKTIYTTNGDKYKWASLEGKVYGQYATRIVRRNSISFSAIY